MSCVRGGEATISAGGPPTSHGICVTCCEEVFGFAPLASAPLSMREKYLLEDFIHAHERHTQAIAYALG